MEAMVLHAHKACMLTPRERVKCVAYLGRYAPGIRNIRENPRCDIISIMRAVSDIIEEENRKNMEQG
jgi:uncharacterized protein (DUF4213/DUF364 family)